MYFCDFKFIKSQVKEILFLNIQFLYVLRYKSLQFSCTGLYQILKASLYEIYAGKSIFSSKSYCYEIIHLKCSYDF